MPSASQQNTRLAKDRRLHALRGWSDGQTDVPIRRAPPAADVGHAGLGGMLAGGAIVSAYREVDTKEAGTKRRRWPDALKRQLVAETLEPGASVSIVARRHDVNANQLFKWRRELASVPRTDTTLLPVAVVQEPAGDPALPSAPVRMVPTPSRIEIVVAGGVRVRIEGAADPAAVTAAVAAVMKARRRR